MPEFWLLELVLVQLLGLVATLVQALGPVVLESRNVEVMRMGLRVLVWLLVLVLRLEWVYRVQLEALRVQMVLLR